jgi:hypothetical protein
MEEPLGSTIQTVRPGALNGFADAAAARLTLSYGLGLDA